MTEGTTRDASRTEATYLIETPQPVERVAEMMAGEQSSGTFVDVPGETDELRERHAARVESTTELETVPEPTLPGSKPELDADADGSSYTRAEVVLSFPLENTGTSLPNLMTTVAGNLYELQPLSGLRLVDLDLPDAFAAENPGGVRCGGNPWIVDVHDRPIIGTIVKPNVGLSPTDTAEVLEPVVDAGVDFVRTTNSSRARRTRPSRSAPRP